MTGAEVNRGRGLPALLAAQLGQHCGKRPIAIVPDQHAHREHRLTATAIQFQAAVRPVRETLAEAEGRRMHRIRLCHERIGNNKLNRLG